VGGYLFMQAAGGPTQASAVAFTNVIATQLAQTLDAGLVEGRLSQSVVYAVGGSLALLVSAVTLPPLRDALGLLSPSPLGWGVIGISSAAAVVISRAVSLLEAAPTADGRPERDWRALLAFKDFPRRFGRGDVETAPAT
jgi:hypothetical protein